MKSAVIALFLGAASATTVRQLFADGMELGEVMEFDYKNEAGVFAQAAEHKHWVELKNCDDKDADKSLPLAFDLSNASKATCKSGKALDLSLKEDAKKDAKKDAAPAKKDAAPAKDATPAKALA